MNVILAETDVSEFTIHNSAFTHATPCNVRNLPAKSKNLSTKRSQKTVLETPKTRIPPKKRTQPNPSMIGLDDRAAQAQARISTSWE